MIDTSKFAGLPVEKGEPVFAAPWQARTFALAVQLHEAGLFSWVEWADELSRQIAEFEQSSAIVDSDDYYALWHHTLENLVMQKC